MDNPTPSTSVEGVFFAQYPEKLSQPPNPNPQKIIFYHSDPFFLKSLELSNLFITFAADTDNKT